MLFLSQRAVARVDVYQYPEGKARFEPLGVVIFAAVMGMASLQIMVEAIKRLAAPTPISLDYSTIGILISTIAAKAPLCTPSAHASVHTSMYASVHTSGHRPCLLQGCRQVRFIPRRRRAHRRPPQRRDHERGRRRRRPSGGKLPGQLHVARPRRRDRDCGVDHVLVASWAGTAMEQISKLAGITAPPEFLQRVTHLAFITTTTC